MHGNNHVYDKFCSKTDYLGLGGNSEFCGHTYENQLEKINKDVSLKFGNRNNFNQKIDELNQETENLIDEIEKWQT